MTSMNSKKLANLKNSFTLPVFNNPNSAAQRVKNHLAYKLGLAMIAYDRRGGGVSKFLLAFKLLLSLNKLKKEHKDLQTLYKKISALFPQFKYPDLKTCSDYADARLVKFHLAYLLGLALAKASKKWYKGGLLKLYSEIKKANKFYKNAQNLKTLFEELNLSKELLAEVLEQISSSKNSPFSFEYFIGQNLDLIKETLNLAQSFIYKEISIPNEVQKFILENLKEIHTWLNSSEFEEKYLLTNHPYPPLLNPQNLNDENQKLNYHSIPAQLAWEMNLPLPSNYLCYFLSASWSAHDATLDMFRYCGVQSVWHHNFDNSYLFAQTYTLINDKSIKAQNKLAFFILYARSHPRRIKGLIEKYFSLTYKPNKAIVYLVRDPISRLKSAINNSWSKGLLRLTLDDDVYDALQDRTHYWVGRADNFMKEIDGFCGYDVFAMNSLLEMMGQNLNVIYVDFDAVLPHNSFKTFEKLSAELHFKTPCKESFPSVIKHNFTGKLLPIELKVNEKIKIHIASTYHKTSWINITSLFYKDFKYESLGIFVENEHIKDEIINDDKLLTRLKEYFEDFFKAFDTQLELEKSRHISEKDVLDYLKQNPFVAKKLKKILDKELIHLKTHRPDIIASWKHYASFERLFELLKV